MPPINLKQPDSRRRHHRLDAPTFIVDASGRTGRTRNWSLGGVAVTFDGSIETEVGAETQMTLIYGAEQQQRGTFEARLIRIDSGNQAAYQFTNMTDEGVDLMAGALKDIMNESCRLLAYRWETSGRYGIKGDRLDA